MFEHNDNYLGKAKTIILVVTIILAVLDVIVLIISIIALSLTSIILSLILGLFTWVFYVMENLVLAFYKDVKYIRNKLYDLDKDGHAKSKARELPAWEHPDEKPLSK